MIGQLKQWDRDLFIYLNGLGIERFDDFWIFVTQEQTWIPLYILFFALVIISHSGKNIIIGILSFLASFAVSFGVTRVIKATIARVRPNNVTEFKDVIRILQEPSYYSFVSGHTSTSVAISTFLVLMLRKRWKWIYIIYLWPILFATSRIYVGVHYPGDILGGAIVGLICAIIVYLLYKKLIDTKLKYPGNS
ncbi:phosphatase PAP2 family protein [Mesonia ostreae]|uniref:Phosphatase PAP2 family protein n=1 Tax=Mesonia ostreae TaxID=861110 RepID=A0ABU2KEX3_9FLAO|nr:phosphatase PAP2 family protein [Mesonia ostreae]MDT0293213.1 phosphatase PAP2 family protein [Mesonia ostreae]